MADSTRRTSPSFIIAIGVVVLALLAYGMWAYLRPSPHAASENVVRELSRTLGREVSAFRREMRTFADQKLPDAKARNAAVASVDERTEKALERIEKHADAARDELSDWDIPIRTQRNRNDRLGTREDEAKELIKGIAEETKEKLREG